MPRLRYYAVNFKKKKWTVVKAASLAEARERAAFTLNDYDLILKEPELKFLINMWRKLHGLKEAELKFLVNIWRKVHDL